MLRRPTLPAANPPGEMAEWLKAHAWKACLLERVTWVRIPLSPPCFQQLTDQQIRIAAGSGEVVFDDKCSHGKSSGPVMSNRTSLSAL
jgi:hypothetical protein